MHDDARKCADDGARQGSETGVPPSPSPRGDASESTAPSLHEEDVVSEEERRIHSEGALNQQNMDRSNPLEDDATPTSEVKRWSSESELSLKRPELSTRVVRSLLSYFEHRFSRAELDRILSACGLERAYLEDEHNWVSMAYRDRLIDAMVRYADDPMLPFHAGRYTASREAIGLGYSILAGLTEPRVLYEKVIELAGQVNRVGRFTILELRDTSLTCLYEPISEEYRDDGPGAEFRLGQLVAWPRLCGLPDATYQTEILEIDGRSVWRYRLDWERPHRKHHTIIGGLLGGALGLISWWLVDELPGIAGALLFTLSGLLISRLYSARQQIHHLSRSIARQHDALSETNMAMQRRHAELHAEWMTNRRLTKSLQRKVEELKAAGEEIRALNAELTRNVRDLETKNTTIAGFNTNLRNRVSEQTVQLREANRRLEEKAQALEESVQLLELKNKHLQEVDEERTRFFAGVNHEFRTPLTLILGALDALRDASANDNPRTDALLTTARQNALRLLRMINSLMELARGEEGRLRLHYEATDLVALIQRILADVRPTATRQGLALETALDPAIPPLYLDQPRMEGILLNLLSNSIKFTPEGGHIHVSASREGSFVHLEVRDDGCGIEADRIPHLFERFADGATASHQGWKGSGLGLSLVKTFVELHNGRIEIESEPGRGTKVRIRFPLGRATIRPEVMERRRAESEVTLERRDSTRNANDLSGLINPIELSLAAGESRTESGLSLATPLRDDRPTLLVIDDNKDLLSLLTEVLGTSFNVVTAADGHDILEKVARLCPDLVLSDVMMNGPDGLTICHTLRSSPISKDIPVILMSAQADAARGIEAGADDYLAKPFHLSELKARIRLHLERRALSKENQETLEALERQNRIIEDQKRALEHLANRDALTGLYNRRYLAEAFAAAFDRARESSSALACVMIDIDHFKAFNTKYGHAGGDAVLREIGGFLERAAGETAIVARYGGEEFAVVLTDHDLKRAAAWTAALLETVRTRTFDPVHHFTIRLSAGVAALPEHDVEDPDQLLNLADEALMRAKDTRDCYQVASIPDEAASASRVGE